MSPHAISAPTVLVVDDMESNRYVISSVLRRAGFNVLEAGTGAGGVAIAAEGGIDLVVLDVHLPDMTGFEACEHIKQLTPGVIPVLHLSATAIDTASRSEGLRRGADAYLVEPVDSRELLATVDALLRSATAARVTLDFARRLRRLNDVTMAIHAAPTIRHLLIEVASGAAELSGGPVVVSAGGRLLVRGEPGEAPTVEVLPADSVAAMPPVELVDTVSRRYDLKVDGVPEAHLVIRVGSEPDQAEATDLLVHQLVQAAAIALENLRSYQAKSAIALTLQRSLLPTSLPPVPGLDLVVRYEASAEYADVGGDFYEVFALDEHRCAVAIGDVAGHSLQAATTMAQLRTAIRAYALEGHGPAANLSRLNSLLLRFHPEMTATVCLLEFDARTGTAEIANAGHLPPLVVANNGPHFVDARGRLLGFDHSLEITPTCVNIEPGQTVVLVTDGLVERRSENIDLGLARLASSCAQPFDGLDTLCERILTEVGPHDGPHDDIALIVLRRHER